MTTLERRHTKLMLVFVLLALSISVFAVGPQTVQISGKVTLKQADGTETVNGTPAVNGATILSDSTVHTAAKSSAVVSLGKLGRVEVLPQTTAKLSFTNSSISVSMLEAGRVRVSSSSGVNAQATTNDGEIVSKGDKQNWFMVDTTCGNTLVAVSKGTVELRAGNSVKQIAAGGQDTAGQARPGCTRSN